MQRTFSVIESGMRAGLHVGAQLYVAHNGHVIADRALGLARPADASRAAQPMTTDSLIVWLSSGKPFTAVAVAQLWERGRLDLDDPVAKFIPEFGVHGKGAITIRHVLTHTAPLRLLEIGWPDSTWDEIVARIAAARPEPRWVPGQTAGYSMHLTWYVLGEIVQRLADQDLATYLHQHVFLPCGMTTTRLAVPPEEQPALGDRLAIMQVTERHPPTDAPADSPQAMALPRPSASVRGPARELGLFYQTMLNRGRGILSPQAVEAMTARHRVNTLDKTFNAVIDWGLGFILNSNFYAHAEAPYQYGPNASRRTFGHSGNQSSTGFADPEHHLVVAVIFNGMPGPAAHQERMRATLAAIYEDLELVNPM